MTVIPLGWRLSGTAQRRRHNHYRHCRQRSAWPDGPPVAETGGRRRYTHRHSCGRPPPDGPDSHRQPTPDTATAAVSPRVTTPAACTPPHTHHRRCIRRAGNQRLGTHHRRARQSLADRRGRRRRSGCRYRRIQIRHGHGAGARLGAVATSAAGHQRPPVILRWRPDGA